MDMRLAAVLLLVAVSYGMTQQPEICLLPMNVGPCRASTKRFYYNKDSGKCEGFSYGGCKGNENRFDTQDDCEKKCLKK